MRGRGGGGLASFALVLAGLVGGWPAHAQTQIDTNAPVALSRPVRLAPGRRPLGAVLRELARQSRLPLSYSSSLVPLAHYYQVHPGPSRPLAEVLGEVLGAEHLRYGLLDGQLVLWPERATPPPGVRLATGQTTTRPVAVGASAAESPAPLAAARVANGPGPQSTNPTKTGPAARRRVAASASGALARPGLAVHPSRQPDKRQVTVKQANISLVYLAATNASKPKKPAHDPPPAGKNAARRPPTAASPPAARHQGPLSPKPIRLLMADQPLPVALPPLAGVPTAPPAAPPDTRLPSQDRRPGLYLHGEAWLSESLPVGVTGKVGLARAYLVLGVAAGPFDHPAWCVGLGTAGRARGRFTPSLDLLEWFVPGDDHELISLTQLRPQLAWQLRRQGRLALLAGPTLNLASADNRGMPRGSFGQHQWLWLDGDGHHSVRGWPGVQVGLRF